MSGESALPTDAVTRRLDILIALTLRNAHQGESKAKEDAVLLASFGLSHPEIAAILGISASGVSKALSRAKKS
jgi:DNA-directed RNA polymerase specialized sigma24 family protein